MSSIFKRTLGELDLGDTVLAGKKAKPEVDVTHPHAILEHLVNVVLVQKCSKEAVKKYYENELCDPAATIQYCKEMLEGWVLEKWQAGKLRDLES
jgi:hypothetical protein